MRMRSSLAAAALLLVIAAGCARNKTLDDATGPRMSEQVPGELDSPAPDRYRVKFETSKGDFIIEATKDLAPIGATRFYRLVAAGFYDDCRFFRVMPGFVVQWGMNGNPNVQKTWRTRKIDDDPVKLSNKRGTITFATSGKNSRTTQVFINLGDNARLDAMGFSAFGKVISGMDVVESINSEYREDPDQGRIERDGNEYLNRKFPRLDYIKKATILKDGESGPSADRKKVPGPGKSHDKAGKTKTN